MVSKAEAILLIDMKVVDGLYIQQGLIGSNPVNFALGKWSSVTETPAFFSYGLRDFLGWEGREIGGILYPDNQDMLYGGEDLDWINTPHYSSNITDGSPKVFSKQIQRDIHSCLISIEEQNISSVILPLMGKGNFTINPPDEDEKCLACEDEGVLPRKIQEPIVYATPELSDEQAARAMLSGIRAFSNEYPKSALAITILFPDYPRNHKENATYQTFTEVFLKNYATPIPSRPLSRKELVLAAQNLPKDKFRICFG